MSNADSSLDALPLEVLEQVDAACEQFERSCQAGSIPRLDEWLEQVCESGRAVAFIELLGLEVEYRRASGQSPTLKEYLERYPDRARDIQHFWSEGDDLIRAAPPTTLGDFRIIHEIGRGGMAVVYLAEQMSLGRRVAIKILPQATVLDPIRRERFQREARSAAALQHANIVPVFGVGCDHDVYYYVMLYIEGESLDKIIQRLKNAQEGMGELKSLLAPTPISDSELQKRDNDSTPKPVPDAPVSHGSSSDSTDRAYFKNVARIIRQAAGGLHHAHQEGILHRDIKPSNMLLDKTGKLWIADFGLAKSQSDAEKLTQTGDVAGTLQYMAPETFQGNADVRSDLYGLGLTLYELLTLHRPFDATDRVRLIDQVLRSEPVTPRRHNPRIPRDLETICLKCVQKEPEKRYATAGELADDLQRFLEGQTIRARPVSPLMRLALWARRRPAIAGLLLLVLVMAIGLLAGLSWGMVATTRWAREAEALAEANRQKLIAQQERAELESKRADAEAARSDSERLRAAEAQVAQSREIGLRQRAEANLVYSRVALAERSWLAGEVVAAKRSLDLCLPRPGEPDLRGWEWHYVHQLCQSELKIWEHKYWVNAVAFSPDGQWLAAAAGSPGLGVGDAQRDSELKIWDVHNSELVATLVDADDPAPALVTVRFSPAGRWLLAGDAAGQWHVWDTRDWLRKVSTAGLDAACLNDEQTLGVIGQRGELIHIDLPSAGEPQSIRAPLPALETQLVGRFSHEGRFAVLRAYHDHPVFVIDSLTGQEIATVQAPPSPGTVAVGPAGKRVVSAESLWDASSGQNLGQMTEQHHQSIYEPSFSPNGGWLAWTAIPRSTPLLARADSPLAPRFLRKHLGDINALVFGPRSEYLASASSDGTVGLWRVETGELHNVFRGHGSGVRHVAFSPDQKLIASAGQDGTVRIWSATRDPRGTLLRMHHYFGENISDFVFSEDSHKLIVAEHHAQYAIDIASGQREGAQPHDMQKTFSLPRSATAFSANGTRLVSASQSEPDVVKVWRGAGVGEDSLPDIPPPRATGDMPESSPYLVHALAGHTTRVRCVAGDERGQRLASLAFDTTEEPADLIVWSGDGERLHRWQTSSATSLAMSLPGHLLAAAGTDGKIRLWDLEADGQPTELTSPEPHIHFLRFSNDSRRLAAATPVGVAIWDIATGEMLLLKTSSRQVTGVAFSPDDTRVATIAIDEGVVHLWDTATGEQVFSLRSLSIARPGAYSFMARVIFSPCGRHIAANNWDASFNIWSVNAPTDRASVER